MADLSPILEAVIARIFPADATHGDGRAFGALTYVEARLEASPAARELIGPGLTTLAERGFAGTDAAHQDALLAGHEGEDWLALLAELVAEGVYADPGNGGNPDAASWAMLDYRHGLPEGPSGPPKRPAPPARAHSGTLDYDTIIVGAGAGGGVAAAVLTEAGHHVLLLERGVERS